MSDLRTVPTEDGPVQYDADMPMKALRGVNRAANDGNLDGIIANFGLFVVSWPYEGSPSEPEAWENLRRSQFAKVVKAVMEDLAKQGEA